MFYEIKIIFTLPKKKKKLSSTKSRLSKALLVNIDKNNNNFFKNIFKFLFYSFA